MAQKFVIPFGDHKIVAEIDDADNIDIIYKWGHMD